MEDVATNTIPESTSYTSPSNTSLGFEKGLLDNHERVLEERDELRSSRQNRYLNLGTEMSSTDTRNFRHARISDITWDFINEKNQEYATITSSDEKFQVESTEHPPSRSPISISSERISKRPSSMDTISPYDVTPRRQIRIHLSHLPVRPSEIPPSPPSPIAIELTPISPVVKNEGHRKSQLTPRTPIPKVSKSASSPLLNTPYLPPNSPTVFTHKASFISPVSLSTSTSSLSAKPNKTIELVKSILKKEKKSQNRSREASIVDQRTTYSDDARYEQSNNEEIIEMRRSDSRLRLRPDIVLKRTAMEEQRLNEDRMTEESAIEEIIKGDWDTNIWETSDDNLIVKVDEETKKTVVEAGTLNELVRCLTTVGDHLYLKTFLVTYKSFATPEILLKKLIELYHSPPGLEISNPGFVKNTQIRVVNAIIHWLEIAPIDWNLNLVQKLDNLIEEMKEQNSPLVGKKKKSCAML